MIQSPPCSHEQSSFASFLRSPLFVLVMILVVLYSIFVINTSYSIGRLSCDSAYDDVDYFNMGYPLYIAFQDGGLAGVLHSYCTNPPRSLYGGAVGALGFTIFGLHDWSPYTTNAIILALFLGYAVCIFQHRSNWIIISVFVYILSLPLSAMIIHDFKCDTMYGICMVIACLMVLGNGTARENATRRRFLWAGTFFGFAMMAKATVFPFTFGMAGLAFSAGAFLAVRYDGCRRSLRSVAKLALAFALPLIAFSTLQMALSGRMIIDYIRINSFGAQRSVWIHDTLLRDDLRYYLDGPGATALGSFLWVCLALFALAAIMALRSKNPRNRALAVCGFLLAAVAYLFVSLNPMKNAFLGIPAQGLFILLPLFLFASFLKSPGQKQYSIETILASGIMLFSIFLFIPAEPIGKNFWYWDGDGPKRKSIDSLLVESILNDAPKEEGMQHVFVATTGFVNATTLQWLFNKAGRSIDVIGVSALTTPEEALRLAKGSDYVITGETGAEGQYTWFPSNRWGDKIDSAIATTPGMHRLAAADSRTGPQFRVYRNATYQAGGNFYGWQNPEGLLLYKDPKSLLAIGRTPSVEFQDTVSRDYLLTLSVSLRINTPSHIVVFADGEKIGGFDVRPGENSNVEIPFKGQSGRNVVRFESSAVEEHPAKDGKVWSITFSKLGISPVVLAMH